MQVYTLPDTMYVEEKQSRNTMQLVQDCLSLADHEGKFQRQK